MAESKAQPQALTLPAERDAGITLGRVSEVDRLGTPTVEYRDGSGATRRCSARTTVALEPGDVGRQAALLFESGRADRPILVGLVHEPLEALTVARGPREAESERALDVQLDDERLLLTAEKEIVLRCGKASITLRKDGRVTVRGTHIVSRSSGQNKMKGATIQLN